ncbi:MAG: hypothetical protein WCK58_02220 [Chloroflexota bacterium]
MSTDLESRRPMLRILADPASSKRHQVDETASFVCTWCALRFRSRSAFDEHHVSSPECRANQKVSSPLQTRYGEADMVWTQPGEMTLHRVRSASCRHRHPRARLVDSTGATIGYQCGWCYGVLPTDLTTD